jgi:hypothetical protein
VSASLAFVGNGPYSGTGLTGRDSLQEGVLDVRVLPAEGRPPRLKGEITFRSWPGALRVLAPPEA